MTVEPLQNDTRRYVLGRHEPRSLMGGRERGEVAVLVAGVALGLLAAVGGGGSVGSFSLLAVFTGAAAVIVFVPYRGRTLYRWLPLDLRHQRQQRNGSQHYVNRARESGVTTGG